MKTFKEIVTFILTALAYILFHLAVTPVEGGYGIDLNGTLATFMNTLPFEIGMTYVAIVFIRKTTAGERPPWDRILRIFFTIGILFGLVYNLYIMGAREQARVDDAKTPSVSLSSGDASLRARLHWA